MKINQFLYSKKTQRSAQFLLILTLCQLFLPTAAFALTGGPSQPEVQSFEPIGTTEMVDLSSGAFNYNIPLLEVEGYPINLAYHAGASMDAEASTVGLGWNINPGVINRNMRGLPDDFNGDAIVEENNRKPNITVGVGAGLSNAELIGLNLGGLSLNLNLGVNYNNYAGVGFEFGMHPSLSCATKNDPDGLGLGLGLGLSSSTSGGATISPSVSYGFYTNKDKDYMRNISLGGSFNRRQGLASLSLGMTHNKVDETIVTTTDANGETASYSKFTAGAGNKASAAVTFGNPTYMPSAQTKMSSLNLALNVKLNPSLFGFDPGLGVNANGYFSVQSIASSERNISNKAYGTLYEQNHTTEDLIDFNREKLMPYTRFQSCNLSVPVMAQDVYGVSGQGIGGSYQLKRNDVGMMHDKSVKSISGGGSIGLEAGFGPPPSVKFGGDADVNISETYTGRWQNDDNQSNLAYRGAVTALDEPAYFKSVGDVAVESDPAFIAKMGNGEPQRIQLNKNGIFDTKANPILESSTGTAVNIGAAGISRAARERRSQAISYLTA
ncbi:MAG: hypothetical protein RI894_190, partial [Bacteroidota bacterium]